LAEISENAELLCGWGILADCFRLSISVDETDTPKPVAFVAGH
jgi:hypothetical protein